jgi:hypothetical protein
MEKQPSKTFLMILLLAIQAAEEDSNYTMRNELQTMYNALTKPVAIATPPQE